MPANDMRTRLLELAVKLMPHRKQNDLSRWISKMPDHQVLIDLEQAKQRLSQKSREPR